MAKKTKRVKKTIRRNHPRPQPQQGVMAIIPLSEIQKPEMHKGKYHLTPSRLTEQQIVSIIAPTPKHIIKKRPGKGGGEWDYIPGWWFKKKLNFVFGFDGWSTEITGERIDGNFITVKGRLIIHNTKDGKPMISKDDYGGASIKFLKGQPRKPENYLDLPNDFKAAQTDLIKRCCVQLGFAMDIYGKSESMDAGQPVNDNDNNPAPQKPAPAKSNTIELKPEPEDRPECWHCANPITEAEAKFSEKAFGKRLCRNCQKLAKEGTISIK